MQRPSIFMLSVMTLIVGLVAGANISHLSFAPAAHANQSDATDVDRRYRELSQEGSAIQEVSTTLAKIAALSAPAVVHIQSKRRIPGKGTEEETGSGVILTSSKASGFFVVTNGHVIDKTALDSIEIHLHDGRTLQPERVWSDPLTDVAVLKINAPNLSAGRWGNSQKLEIGHLVLAMGSPFGLSRSVTLGIISAKGRRQLKLGQSSEVLNQDFLQTDAAINPGNSGGPLIDLQGGIIGINTAIASSSGGNEGIGFSIPSSLAQRVMEQLLEFGVVHRAWIGVKLDEKFDAKIAAKLKLDRMMGTRISDVFPNSPAQKAGLLFDDVILSFDGVDVQDHDDLINLVSLSPIAKKIQVVVWRGGRKMMLTIVLADRGEMPPTSQIPFQPEFGTPVRAMGLTVGPLDEDLADQVGYSPQIRGLLILKVDSDSALGHRLEPNDVLGAIGHTPVTSVEELNLAIEETHSRKSVVLHVHRASVSDSPEQLVIWRRTAQ